MELGWLGFIVLGACLFVPIWLLIKAWKNDDEYSLLPYTIGGKISYTLIMFPISCFAALLAFAMISSFVSLFNFTTEKEVNRATYENIHSIAVNNSVEGHFTLGCGSVEGKTVYRYFVKRNGGYQCDEVDAQKTTIIESDCTPHIKYIHSYRYTGEPNWFLKAYFGDSDFWRVNYANKSIIYVPRGSVVQTYEIRP